ncbi:hypothetical protein FX981_00542 [Bacillus safensis]|uniref:Uncharacterized protein n=1 Tax=Bacillus safensis TaxID=561879 RepID=A0A5C0WF29_BACIA|nr:hypothetical protein FX981_00542 [Bacillus safensis]
MKIIQLLNLVIQKPLCTITEGFFVITGSVVSADFVQAVQIFL